MKLGPQFLVYLVGIIVLGLLYVPMKSALGGQWLFVLAVVCYLLALRLLGFWLAKARLKRDAKP
jgi:predicted ABC-type exoprotein transport system permease subunit